jgi:cystathionine gamma-lyase
LGADIVCHSITKYIGGHSDVVMGCIMLNDKDLYDKLFFIVKCKFYIVAFNLLHLIIAIGSGASPFDCYLALRGSKTLAVRMDRAMANAKEISTFLEKHPKVEKIIYPGLKSHPQYALTLKQSRGPGAMMSFYVILLKTHIFMTFLYID